MLPSQVKIVEVGPRDGLQNENAIVSAETRISLIHQLASAGLHNIEVGAFVSPQWVPQMAETADVLAGLDSSAANYSVLVPNMQGFEKARAMGIKEIAVFGSASESFSQKNINCSIAESLDRFRPVVEMAQKHNIKARGYVSCVVDCPYEGEIQPDSVTKVARAMYDMGCYEISLGDTIGTGTVDKTRVLLDSVLTTIPKEAIAVHFHDTCGQALVNIYAALQQGIGIIDSSVGGLGGCPYAKGASGNVATEDLVYMLSGLGIDTGIDNEKLIATASWIFEKLGRLPAGRLANRNTTE